MFILFIMLASPMAWAGDSIDTRVIGKVGCDDQMECHYIYAGGILFPDVVVNIESTDGPIAVTSEL